MRTINQSVRTTGISLTVTLLLGFQAAAAAPGDLAQSPLFLGNSVQPNIFFALDDSGSMDWEILTRDTNNGGLFTGTQPDGSSADNDGDVKHRDADDDGDADCDFSDEGRYGYEYIVEFGSNTFGDDGSDCRTADDEAWRVRNSDFNALYFDPDQAYKPWAGVDANGDPLFGNIDIHNAPDDPYNPRETIDLTRDNSNWDTSTNTNRKTSDRDGDGKPDGFRYYSWNDKDNDGNFDNGEETEFLIKNQSASVQQSFANWFSYYRKREYVLKAAVAELINDSQERMGLATLHNNNDIGTPIRDMRDQDNKDSLLDQLSNVSSNGGTPLRRFLARVGRYYTEGGTNSDHDQLGFVEGSPILEQVDGGECQQNFTILMTDGFWNGDEPDVDDADGDDNSEWDTNPGQDNQKNTLADVAMRYYEEDLSPLGNEVPVITGVDENDAQHMVTYGVAFGVNGDLDSSPPDHDDSTPPPNGGWPVPSPDDPTTIDDLRHAAFNSRGQFLSAQDPQGLIDSLQAAIDAIADRQGSGAAVSFDGEQLTAGTQIFIPGFNSKRWSGNLQAFEVDPVDGDISSAPTWEAAERLDDLPPGEGAGVPSARTIYTQGTDSNGDAVGVPFKWASLTAEQRADFRTNPDGTVAADTAGGIAEARLNYIRGDRGNELQTGGILRQRDSRLGDIVHSSPVFVGEPDAPWPDNGIFGASGDRYSDFRASQASRPGVVYVGANDGMLHGFLAEDSANLGPGGMELMAYVPASLYSSETNAGLHYLTDPDYAHSYYVDGTPATEAAQDVYIPTASPGGAAAWRTVLIGGLRGGGQGLYALDITDPTDFNDTSVSAQKHVLWEFTDDDDPDLGFTFGKPQIVKMANGQWAAIVGNGYNNAGSGSAQLFILYIKEGLDGWQAGDYVKLDTRTGSPSIPNGLSTPLFADLDGDLLIDRIYAGDLQGNLWAFDVSSDNDNEWQVAYGDPAAPEPLFTTPDTTASGATINQPITVKPTLTRLKSVPTNAGKDEPNLILFFGTGQYLTESDKSSTEQQAFYAVWDAGVSSLTKSDLVEQTIQTASADSRTTTDKPVNYDDQDPESGNFGWYINLFASGERVVEGAMVRNTDLNFTAIIPTDGFVCSSDGGDSFVAAVSTDNGGPASEPAIDANQDGEINSQDLGPNNEVITFVKKDELILGTTGISNILFLHGATGDTERLNLRPTPADDVGRLSWQELVQ